jgi:DNA transformation protein
MGTKGDKQTGASAVSAERLQRDLSHLGEIRTRKMFGGYGVFETDAMFALVDSEGGIYFKADETNVKRFEEAGSPKHARMPYYRVPDAVLEDAGALQKWAQASMAISKKGK